MVGRDVSSAFPSRKVTIGEPLLEVRGLTSESGITDVSFQVRAGEVLALAGLMGSGRTEVARALFGADVSARGTVTLQGQPLVLGSVERAVSAGLAPGSGGSQIRRPGARSQRRKKRHAGRAPQKPRKARPVSSASSNRPP